MKFLAYTKGISATAASGCKKGVCQLSFSPFRVWDRRRKFPFVPFSSDKPATTISNHTLYGFKTLKGKLFSWLGRFQNTKREISFTICTNRNRDNANSFHGRYDRTAHFRNFNHALYDCTGHDVNFHDALYHRTGVAVNFIEALYHRTGGAVNFLHGLYDRTGGAANFIKGLYDRTDLRVNFKHGLYTRTDHVVKFLYRLYHHTGFHSILISAPYQSNYQPFISNI